MLSLRCMLLAGLISMGMTWRNGRGGPQDQRGGGQYGGPRERRPPGQDGPGRPCGSEWQGGPGGPGGPRGQGGPGGPGGSGGPGGPRGQGGPGGHGGPRGFKFPACNGFSEAMHKEMCAMRENGEGGPENCVDGDHEACMWEDMMTARCRIGELISPECIEQVNMFMNGECERTPVDREY